eukprot:scaffold22128_cov95-Phaeocystis_antarctica.AAC.1
MASQLATLLAPIATTAGASPSRSCHAAELPIVQPKLRQATNVDSVHGAQVDPFIPRRITESTPFVLFGFCNVL